MKGMKEEKFTYVKFGYLHAKIWDRGASNPNVLENFENMVFGVR